MRTIYVVMFVLTALVLIGVLGAVLRAVRSHGSAAGPERRTRGSRGVQQRVGIGIGGVVVVLFVVGIIFSEKARHVDAAQSGVTPITIDATGQQWLWRYEYPEAQPSADGYSSDTAYSYYDLTIPVDTPITLDFTSIDVLHRWSVPSLAPAVEAVPGRTSSVTFTADRVGDYEGRSTEFSGPGYTTMRTRIHVVEPDQFADFLKQRTADIKAARAAVQKQVDAGTAPGVALEK